MLQFMGLCIKFAVYEIVVDRLKFSCVIDAYSI